MKTSHVIYSLIVVCVIGLHLAHKAKVLTENDKLKHENELLKSEINVIESRMRFEMTQQIFNQNRIYRDSLLNEYHAWKTVDSILLTNQNQSNEKTSAIILRPVDERIRYLSNYLDNYGRTIEQ
jgi:hypothetical protein